MPMCSCRLLCSLLSREVLGTTPSGSLRCSTGGVDDSRLERLNTERLHDDRHVNTACQLSSAAQNPPSHPEGYVAFAFG